MTHGQMARTIRAFLDGSIDKWGWDDLISIPQKNRELEAFRLECASLPETYPPESGGRYCGVAGRKRLEEIAAELESVLP